MDEGKSLFFASDLLFTQDMQQSGNNLLIDKVKVSQIWFFFYPLSNPNLVWVNLQSSTSYF